jgi:hypothetical protein
MFPVYQLNLPAHSLQYHTVLILLHRPFLRRHNPSTALFDFLSTTDLSHNRNCSSSAESITSVMRSYRTHFTLVTCPTPLSHEMMLILVLQRRIPISTVHAVGTASVIHLLGVTSEDPVTSKSAARLLKFNFTCLEEMGVAWTWSLRAIESLNCLAAQWHIGEKMMAQGGRAPGSTKKTTAGEANSAFDFNLMEGNELLDWPKADFAGNLSSFWL